MSDGDHVRTSYEKFSREATGAHAALIALGKSAEQSGLDKGLIELVKIRVSQMNGCAFCLNHHLVIARRLGVEAAKLDLVAAWRDAGIFSPREQAALAWAESLTALTPVSASDEIYARLQLHFSESEALDLSVAVATINAWNRLGVGLRFVPPVSGTKGT